MTCSCGTSRPSGPTATKRARPSGTFTRAERSSPLSESRTRTARLCESPEMYGNGCPGPTASGVSTGKMVRRTAPRDRPAPAACSSATEETTMPSSASAGTSTSLQSAAWRSVRSMTQLADLGKRRAGRPAVGRAGGEPCGDLPLEPGDAHHEELVEVGRDDRAEADALEDGQVVVAGLLEHAHVEREPAAAPGSGTGCRPVRPNSEWWRERSSARRVPVNSVRASRRAAPATPS